MKRYLITITLSDGDQVEARSIGNNQEQALARLEQTQQFLDFVADRDITHVEITCEGEASTVNPEHFIVQKGIKHPDQYFVSDLRNNVVAIFAKGRYNETVTIKPLYDTPEKAVDMATIIREIGEYIALYHKELL